MKAASAGDWSAWGVRPKQSLRKSVNLVVELSDWKREKFAPKFIEPGGAVRQVHGAGLYANRLRCHAHDFITLRHHPDRVDSVPSQVLDEALTRPLLFDQ